MLREGVNIVVATPGKLVLFCNRSINYTKICSGRLEDLISTEEMSLSQCRFFILDEADGLLTSGYENLIRRIHEKV